MKKRLLMGAKGLDVNLYPLLGKKFRDLFEVDYTFATIRQSIFIERGAVKVSDLRYPQFQQESDNPIDRYRSQTVGRSAQFHNREPPRRARKRKSDSPQRTLRTQREENTR
jgi:hypothetical protein